MIPSSFRDELVNEIPALRAFAISLCGRVDWADDLVQEALLRALANAHRFQPGTCLLAWLITILRNYFRTQYRRDKRMVGDPEGILAARLSALPNQNGRLEINELVGALAKLPLEQRETL